jgi:ferredoxin
MEEQTKNKIELNREDCTGCGICLESCRPKALNIGAEQNHYGVYPVQRRDEACEACGTCYYLCPEPGAISLFHEDNDWEFDQAS